MCSQSKLFNSSHGLVTYCSECNEFQVLFGTTGLRFGANEFKEFCDYVRYLEPDIQEGNNVKNNAIPIPGQNHFLALTSSEFVRLKTIISCSLASLQIDAILAELNIPRSA